MAINVLEFIPWSLSLRSARLLVTSREAKQLRIFDAWRWSTELTRIKLPEYMTPWHAVESSVTRGCTIIVSHDNTQLDQYQISEINTDATVLRRFTDSLGLCPHVAVDTCGKVFVADYHCRRILLLDAQLKLRRVIVDEYQLNRERPRRLCYRERTGQLLVGFYQLKNVAIIDARLIPCAEKLVR